MVAVGIDHRAVALRLSPPVEVVAEEARLHLAERTVRRREAARQALLVAEVVPDLRVADVAPEARTVREAGFQAVEQIRAAVFVRAVARHAIAAECVASAARVAPVGHAVPEDVHAARRELPEPEARREDVADAALRVLQRRLQLQERELPRSPENRVHPEDAHAVRKRRQHLASLPEDAVRDRTARRDVRRDLDRAPRHRRLDEGPLHEREGRARLQGRVREVDRAARQPPVLIGRFAFLGEVLVGVARQDALRGDQDLVLARHERVRDVRLDGQLVRGARDGLDEAAVDEDARVARQAFGLEEDALPRKGRRHGDAPAEPGHLHLLAVHAREPAARQDQPPGRVGRRRLAEAASLRRAVAESERPLPAAVEEHARPPPGEAVMRGGKEPPHRAARAAHGDAHLGARLARRVGGEGNRLPERRIRLQVEVAARDLVLPVVGDDVGRARIERAAQQRRHVHDEGGRRERRGGEVAERLPLDPLVDARHDVVRKTLLQDAQARERRVGAEERDDVAGLERLFLEGEPLRAVPLLRHACAVRLAAAPVDVHADIAYEASVRLRDARVDRQVVVARLDPLQLDVVRRVGRNMRAPRLDEARGDRPARTVVGDGVQVADRVLRAGVRGQRHERGGQHGGKLRCLRSVLHLGAFPSFSEPGSPAC